MAEFERIDAGEPVEMSGNVGFVPMLFRIHPDDPEEEPGLVYSIQKFVRKTDIQGNDSWRDVDQALWVTGTPHKLAKGLEQVGQALRDLNHPGTEDKDSAQPDSDGLAQDSEDIDPDT